MSTPWCTRDFACSGLIESSLASVDSTSTPAKNPKRK
jgi:hypothetical protein